MRWMLIAVPLVILIDCITFINFFTWQQQSVYEFQQRQLDLQVNYAVDAAAQEMLSSGTHIGTDYIDWGSVTVEPEIALDVYTSVLLRNLGWSDYERNREDLIESSMPFFLVATYDGYYVYCRQKDEIDYVLNGGQTAQIEAYPFHWTPKLPYSKTVGDNVYFYYLGADTYGSCNIADKTSALTSVKRDNPLMNGNGAGSYNDARLTITDTITKACNSALYLGLEGNTDSQFYIPAEMSDWADANPITSPSILVYMSRSDNTVLFDTITFGIGGSKIDSREFVICYSVNGAKLYAWADDRDSIINTYHGESNFILEVLTSPEEAASKGYYLDYKFYHKEG